MRLAVALAASLAIVGVARAVTVRDIVPVGKPAFTPPLSRFTPRAVPRLEIVSSTPRDPGGLGVDSPELRPSPDLPSRLDGIDASNAFAQPGTTFVVYGTGLIAGFGPRGGMKYAFDLRSFGFPPRSLAPRAYGPQELTWARQLGRTLVVQTNHLGYASDSGGRNGYLTGVDLDTGRVTWRSAALVANARNFVVTRGLIVSGYGFTAEKDWLYVVDPRTGRVRDRLALPSAAERITLRGGRIVVRCYDVRIVARLVPA